MLPDIQPGNTKILYFFNCLLDGMHTIRGNGFVCSSLNELKSKKVLYFFCDFGYIINRSTILTYLS